MAEPEYWTRQEQYRYEDRMAAELKELNDTLKTLMGRVTMFMGAIALMAFLLPLVIPFFRAWLPQ